MEGIGNQEAPKDKPQWDKMLNKSGKKLNKSGKKCQNKKLSSL